MHGGRSTSSKRAPFLDGLAYADIGCRRLAARPATACFGAQQRGHADRLQTSSGETPSSFTYYVNTGEGKVACAASLQDASAQRPPRHLSLRDVLVHAHLRVPPASSSPRCLHERLAMCTPPSHHAGTPADTCNACSTIRLPEHPRCSGSPQYELVGGQHYLFIYLSFYLHVPFRVRREPSSRPDLPQHPARAPEEHGRPASLDQRPAPLDR